MQVDDTPGELQRPGDQLDRFTLGELRLCRHAGDEHVEPDVYAPEHARRRKGLIAWTAMSIAPVSGRDRVRDRPEH